MASKLATKMYGEDGKGPRLERDEKSGNMAVKKSDKGADKEAVTEGGAESETADVGGRHSMDRMSMHHKHEMEHMMHKGGDKKEMHARHEEEMKMMHKRHEKEHGRGE